MTTKSIPETAPGAAPEQSQQQSAPTPAHGGSYLVDDQTGEHTLVERTRQTNEAPLQQ